MQVSNDGWTRGCDEDGNKYTDSGATTEVKSRDPVLTDTRSE